MAGQQQDMDLNSRERRLVARRVQQQQLLNHLASTMMQGQASSSSGGNTEGGLEAVGHMLVNWSQGRKEAQAKKVPKFVPPPPKLQLQQHLGDKLNLQQHQHNQRLQEPLLLQHQLHGQHLG